MCLVNTTFVCIAGEGWPGARPLNSALEVDLDFERAVRPPPAPSEAATVSLEDLIRRRVAERQWDDPPKLVLPAPEKKRREIEFDDKKSVKACLPRDGVCSSTYPVLVALLFCWA